MRAVARDAHDQLTILLRIIMRGDQRLLAQDVELDVPMPEPRSSSSSAARRNVTPLRITNEIRMGYLRPGERDQGHHRFRHRAHGPFQRHLHECIDFFWHPANTIV